ncbi:MAG TPA: DUF2298 domain-containing protein, partial [Aggregatilineales bacterium]|nr:DUF2298 domain-containing protein [Aggregatilineales bacterium]
MTFEPETENIVPESTVPGYQESDSRWHLITPLVVILFLMAMLGALGVKSTDRELVWDWLGREGGAVFMWWLLSSLAGIAVMPILFTMLPGLPGRGYALARAAGLMLVGFVFWYVASLGMWENTPGSIALAWLVVAAMGAMIWQRKGKNIDLKAYLHEHWTFMLVVEILFASMLFGWAIFRAYEPEIRSTEKPMEMMFVNSIRESEFFPPNDGWLAGYSISYYYFGYVIIAGLADVSGVNSGIAFGLIGPLLFALSGINIFGVVYDLVRLRRGESGRHGAIWVGILGVVMLVIMGNLGAFLIEQPWNGQGLMKNFARIWYFDYWDVPERSNLVYDTDVNDGQDNWYA